MPPPVQVRKQHIRMTVHLVFAMFCLGWAQVASGDEGYAAMGHLTFTRFDPAETAVYKRVMLFHVQIAGERWRIRTEPAIEAQGGIGFYEASSTPDGSILMVTGFEAAYSRDESPFKGLRAEVMRSAAAEVFFTNRPNASLPSSGFPPPGYEKSLEINPRAKHINNVAVATAFKTQYPPVNPSYAAFLWFAFTPPKVEHEDEHALLLQVWDDGNTKHNRFRRARWRQSSEMPHLVSSAVYDWPGIQILPSGAREKIKILDVSPPQELAARYEVRHTTNYGGLTLPVDFGLTRFTTKRSENGERKVSSIIIAAVAQVTRFPSEQLREATVPGRTVVSDFRLSSGELRGAPLEYLIESNSPPPVEDLQGTALYRRNATRLQQTAVKSTFWRWILLGFVLLPLVGAFLRWIICQLWHLDKNVELSQTNDTPP